MVGLASVYVAANLTRYVEYHNRPFRRCSRERSTSMRLALRLRKCFSSTVRVTDSPSGPGFDPGDAVQPVHLRGLLCLGRAPELAHRVLEFVVLSQRALVNGLAQDEPRDRNA